MTKNRFVRPRRSSSSCEKHRYFIVIFLALSSAIMLFHTFTVHRLVLLNASPLSTTTGTAVHGEGVELRRQVFNQRKKDDPISDSMVRRRHNKTAQDLPKKGFDLAHTQSFGFFDDIPNHQWQRAQQLHAKTFPNFYQKPLSIDLSKSQVKDEQQQEPVVSLQTSKIDHVESQISRYTSGNFNDEQARKESSLWYAENFQVEFHCPLAQRIPSTGEGDGPKWVCDPHRIAAQDDCLVYSVGSNGNVLFEKGIRQEIGSHCEIHTFDIRERSEKNVVFSKVLSKYGAEFHHWGIGTPEEAAAAATLAKVHGSSNITSTAKRRQRMKTFQQTIVELNHSHRAIDILKIDCESCEWYQYQTWFEAMRAENVTIRQILVETHHIQPRPSGQQLQQQQQQQQSQARNFFMALHDAGYVIFSKEANYEAQASCVEFAFLKLSTDFFVNDTLYYPRYTRVEPNNDLPR